MRFECVDIWIDAHEGTPQRVYVFVFFLLFFTLAAELRVWRCRLREKRELPSRGEGLRLLTVLNLLGRVTRRRQPLEKDTRVLN